MSSFKGHIFFCIFLSVGILYLLKLAVPFLPFLPLQPILNSPEKVYVLLSLAVLFSLFPDVDTNSVGQHIFYLVFACIDTYLIIQEKYKQSAFLGLICMLPAISRHRGMTHTRLAALLVTLPILIAPALLAGKWTWDGLPYFISALVGYISHLIVDKKFF